VLCDLRNLVSRVDKPSNQGRHQTKQDANRQSDTKRLGVHPDDGQRKWTVCKGGVSIFECHQPATCCEMPFCIGVSRIIEPQQAELTLGQAVIKSWAAFRRLLATNGLKESKLMPLLKLLHFIALIGWCGVLLYLPVLIAAGTRSSAERFRDHAHLTRTVFNLVATPAALITIGSGTALFLRQTLFDPWLIAKLTAVAGMVICHALCGVLILRIEREPNSSVGRACVLIAALVAMLISTTLWLVLGKPF
jgi:putative membrane protein